MIPLNSTFLYSIQTLLSYSPKWVIYIYIYTYIYIYIYNKVKYNRIGLSLGNMFLIKYNKMKQNKEMQQYTYQYISLK